MQKNSFLSTSRIFAVPQMNTKNICSAGLLIAMTIVLSAVSGYLRLGNIGKLSLSFAPVFVASAAFGGITGGFVAAAADIVSYLVNPVGAFIPLLTLIEFIYGFVYGFFFYKLGRKNYVLSVALCDVFQLAVNIFLKSAVLSSAFGNPYTAVLAARIPMSAIQFVRIFAVLILLKPFLRTFFEYLN